MSFDEQAHKERRSEEYDARMMAAFIKLGQPLNNTNARIYKEGAKLGAVEVVRLLKRLLPLGDDYIKMGIEHLINETESTFGEIDIEE